MTPAARFLLLIYRAIRLRCPCCGRGKLFRGWFRMPERCESCQTKFEREPGFFLGSIYVNYGLTALLVTTAYLSLLLGFVMQLPREEQAWWETALLTAALAFSVLFPVWFFRYARSLWLGFDQFADPREQSYKQGAKDDV